ncbi:type I secretion system permease/ATPase [Pectobacterium parmentieri]|uniref:Toxin secretion ATP-binding protein n=1 Tax=Pectobacterium parmentieri TaxID=1905730 RepID=A0A0H3I1G3_PECPM|nr:type I secretion system permease/ATPase [Pectobacterium parmentieri]AFI89224.1 Toxin secretion ATP-binding protein [Pectobacterium parmentieri]AOR59776.1 ABC transporter [Pectobacterium parmentieri]AYH00505.1 type I secretion system permease/ATPase [Pectobacterium parmentieri]AYH04950.1 type I secretion system permease/ATPase [Pectobacterium parmentieri]AYH09226.1 type I secretion system permease/ATPase [Pectobacterium parmentieri]
MKLHSVQETKGSDELVTHEPTIHEPIVHENSDPRSRHDDPLLDGLLILCALQGKSVSRTTLTAGLPLANQRLSVKLLPRAAARAGLQGRVLKRSLNKISEMSLPAMLLLREGGAAILLGWNVDGSARLMPSETEGGEISVEHNTLQQNYLGLVMFAQPRHQFDLQNPSLIPHTKSWFRDTLKLSRSLYLDAILASLLVNIIALATPLFVMNVYDRVVPNQATATLWVLAIGVTGAFVFDLILKTLRGICLDMAGKKTDLIISATLFERITGMSMKARPPRVGSFAQNIHEFQSLRDFLSSLTLTTLIDFPFTLLLLLVIGIIGGPLVWVSILAYPIALLASWAMQKPLSATIEKTMHLASERQATLIETLSCLDAIKVNNAESERQHQWEQTIGSLSKLEMRVKALSSLAVNLTQWFQQFAGVAMIVVGVYLLINGKLSMGGLIACYMLNGRALMPLGQLSGLVSRYQQARLTMQTTEQMMQLPQERSDNEHPLKRESIRGGIEFRDVTFNYPEQKTSSLQSISLTIAPGEKVGVIGRSGSGKSSLQKLIVNLYQPNTGNILIDGVDARQLDVSDLRHNIGYVPQDIQLFSGSLRNNLISGARYVEDEAMLRAAEISGVNEFARLHPDGYNLQVGERGQQLSGGQRQAVAIARALLLDPPILVLDEPTSSMDNTSEDRLKQALTPIIAEKTLLLVTHRVSMLALVDRLVIVDKGKIIADGPKAIVMDALKKGQINASR